jgi:signal transduction histidine kinase
LSYVAAASQPETIASVLERPIEEFTKTFTVCVRGVVTYHKPQGVRDTIVQDESGGIFLNTGDLELPQPLRPGLEIEVSGLATIGSFSPRINAGQITVLGEKPLPEPRWVGVDELRTGECECRYIEFRGVIRSATVNSELTPPRLLLHVATPAGGFDAWVLHFGDETGARLIDAAVRVRGVCLAWENTRRQFRDLRVLVDNLDAITVERSPLGDPFAAPLVKPETLWQYRPQGLSPHRVRLRGTVTDFRSGQDFVLQTNTVGVRVTTKLTAPLAVGDEVEAVGFPALGSYSAELQDAVYRVLRSGTPPEPTVVSAINQPYESNSFDFDQRLVRIEGKLLASENVGSHTLLTLEDEGFRFTAELPAQAANNLSLSVGSRLELVGISQIALSDEVRRFGGALNRYSVRLRSLADVRVLSAGPWLTRERLLLALQAAGILLLVTGCWTFLLRLQVKRRTGQLVGEVLARHESSLEQQAVSGERARVAADLHDTLEQTLTGLALQLQAEELSQRNGRSRSPVAGAHSAFTDKRPENHLAVARQLLERSRNELRAVVTNLRDKPEERVDLGAELQGLLLGMTAGAELAVTISQSGEPRPISQAQAHHLGRIAQEAIANAAKHAQARSIRVELAFAARELTLRISDDGRGFHPLDVPGPDAGHYGLESLRARAAKIGVALSIQSEPNKGTSVIVVCPMT